MKTNASHPPKLDRALARLQQAIGAGQALPDLQELAAAAHLSPFHFHRVWRALTGETVGRTAQRLRLLAALHGLPGEASVTDIALRVGYDTPQALARVFREVFDASPTQLRADPELRERWIERLSKPSRRDAIGLPPLSVEVVALQPLEVVALRRQGAFDELDAGFGELFGWAAQHGLVERLQQLVGIPLDDHRDVAPEELRFDCGLVFDSSPPQPPAPLRCLRLEGGMAARLRHVGAYSGLEDACDRLLAEWLPGSGHALRDAPVHYHFLDDPEEVPEAILRADLYVPLAG